jgi:hypothetical protein
VLPVLLCFLRPAGTPGPPHRESRLSMCSGCRAPRRPSFVTPREPSSCDHLRPKGPECESPRPHHCAGGAISRSPVVRR